MKVFTDRTGLAAPRNWSQRQFPPGLADHPVTGVSWYEAAAYAAFRGKELPTVFQWEKAARNGNAAPPFNYMPWGTFFPGDSFRQRANFDGATTMPVTANPIGASPFGAYNMAGNVAEWCQNDSDAGHFTSGGAFGDPVYMFARFGTFRAFTRRTGSDSVQPGVARPRVHPMRARCGSKSRPTCRSSPRLLRHNSMSCGRSIATRRRRLPRRSPSRSKRPTGSRDDRVQRRRRRARDRVYVPAVHASRPVQVIHYLPGTGVELGAMGLQSNMEAMIGASVRAGRAMFGVALRGYQERRPPGGASEPAGEDRRVPRQDRQLGHGSAPRARLPRDATDMDRERIAFVGQSSGARTGSCWPRSSRAIDPCSSMAPAWTRCRRHWSRARTHRLRAPHQGADDDDAGPARRGDPARRRTPSRCLRCLKEPKRLVLYDGGHMAPTELLVKELNAWLDQTLGPVKR